MSSEGNKSPEVHKDPAAEPQTDATAPPAVPPAAATATTKTEGGDNTPPASAQPAGEPKANSSSATSTPPSGPTKPSSFNLAAKPFEPKPSTTGASSGGGASSSSNNNNKGSGSSTAYHPKQSASSSSSSSGGLPPNPMLMAGFPPGMLPPGFAFPLPSAGGFQAPHHHQPGVGIAPPPGGFAFAPGFGPAAGGGVGVGVGVGGGTTNNIPLNLAATMSAAAAAASHAGPAVGVVPPPNLGNVSHAALMQAAMSLQIAANQQKQHQGGGGIPAVSPAPNAQLPSFFSMPTSNNNSASSSATPGKSGGGSSSPGATASNNMIVPPQMTPQMAAAVLAAVQHQQARGNIPPGTFLPTGTSGGGSSSAAPSPSPSGAGGGGSSTPSGGRANASVSRAGSNPNAAHHAGGGSGSTPSSSSFPMPTPQLKVNVGNASLAALKEPPKFACVVTLGLPRVGTTTASRDVVKSLEGDNLPWCFFSGGDHLKSADATAAASGEKQSPWEASKNIFDALSSEIDGRIKAQSGDTPIRGLLIDKHFRGIEDLYYLTGLLRNKHVALHGIVSLDCDEEALISRLRARGELSGADQIEPFRERLRFRRVLLTQLKEIGKSLGIWHTVDADQSLEQITQKLRGVVLGCSAKPPMKGEVLVPSMYHEGAATFVDSVDTYHRVMSQLMSLVRTPYRKYPGTIPKPLSRQVMTDTRFNFKDNYYVRRKSDGTKYVLFYDGQGLFLVPKHMRCVFLLPDGAWIGVPLKQVSKFILEGELTRLSKERSREKFLVHDALCWCERDSTTNILARAPWKERHELLTTRLCNEASAFFSRDNVIIVHQLSVPFSKAAQLFEPCDYPTEGICLQPVQHPQRWDAVWLWRSPELVTLDFRLGRVISGEALSNLATPSAASVAAMRSAAAAEASATTDGSSSPSGGMGNKESTSDDLKGLVPPSPSKPAGRTYVLEVFDIEKARYVEFHNGTETVTIKGGTRSGILPGAIVLCAIDPSVLAEKKLLPSAAGASAATGGNSPLQQAAAEAAAQQQNQAASGGVKSPTLSLAQLASPAPGFTSALSPFSRWVFLRVRNDVFTASIKTQAEDTINDCLISRTDICGFLGVDSGSKPVGANAAPTSTSASGGGGSSGAATSQHQQSTGGAGGGASAPYMQAALGMVRGFPPMAAPPVLGQNVTTSVGVGVGGPSVPAPKSAGGDQQRKGNANSNGSQQQQRGQRNANNQQQQQRGGDKNSTNKQQSQQRNNKTTDADGGAAAAADGNKPAESKQQGNNTNKKQQPQQQNRNTNTNANANKPNTNTNKQQQQQRGGGANNKNKQQDDASSAPNKKTSASPATRSASAGSAGSSGSEKGAGGAGGEQKRKKPTRRGTRRRSNASPSSSAAPSAATSQVLPKDVQPHPEPVPAVAASS